MEPEGGSARSTGGLPGGASAPDWETLTPAEFETMVQELANPLMATALRLTRHRAEAEDLVQESLYRAYRSLSSFRKGSRFRAWMFRILHNAFINRSRREGLAPVAVDPVTINREDVSHPVPGMTSVDELPDLADHHFDEQVKGALDELPEVYRMPLVLFALGDLSYQEIADTLEVPIGTVMSRLHRARRQLKDTLAEYVAQRRLGGVDGPR